jgi:FkbM family methyltransferase
MKKLAKKIVREALKLINLKLSFYDKSKPRYIKAIDSLGINMIFDVGANSGQFALEVLQNGFRGKIVSFEPTSKIYETLQVNSERFPNWQLHERTAVGEKCGTVVINVAGNNAASSSILSMRKTHQEAAPEANFVSSESVNLITIDSIFDDYTSGESKCLLKIDVQGYEEQVLTGALASINKIDAVKIECSLVSLYEGDKTFEYYFKFFKSNGFELFDIETGGFSNPVTGQLLQFDALFIKNNSLLIPSSNE